VTPDGVLVFLIYWAGRKERTWGSVLGFVGGVLQDFVGGGTLGVYAFSKSVACYIAGYFPKSRVESPVWLTGGILFVSAFVHQFLYCVLTCRKAAAGILIMFLRYGIPSAVYTSLVGMAAYGLADLKNRRRETK